MILIVDKIQSRAAIASDMLYYMGILSCPITPDKALAEINNRYRAVLIMNPEQIDKVDELAISVRRFSLGAKIFAISQSSEINSSLHGLFDKTFAAGGLNADVVSEIIRFGAPGHTCRIGTYRALGIDASISLDSVRFFDTDIHFTRTETMIIRYLILRYLIQLSKPKTFHFLAFYARSCCFQTNPLSQQELLRLCQLDVL